MFDHEQEIRVGNVMIVLSQDTAIPTPVTYGEYLRFCGDPMGTVELPVAGREPEVFRWKQIKKLFGKWVKNEQEDQDLEELYRSRRVPSSGPEEEV